MRISEHTLKDAWRQLAEAGGLPAAAALPPTGSSPEQYDRYVGDPGGLFLVVDGDGTVRGHRSPYQEVFATRDLDLALYFAAEEAVGGLAGEEVAGRAAMLEAIDPEWGRRFRSGGLDADSTPTPPCGGDPLEGLAWIAGNWRDQVPYTNLAFFRGGDVSAEQIALAYGADPGSTAAGTRLADLREAGCNSWETFCFGQAGDWVFLLYDELPPGHRADSAAAARLGVTETVLLTAISAKAIYTFGYTRDGRPVDDGRGVIELIWYARGRAPYYRGGQLDFLNRAIRRAELDHPEVADEFELYFHGLETGLGLRLPQQAFREGTVRAAPWRALG